MNVESCHADPDGGEGTCESPSANKTGNPRQTLTVEQCDRSGEPTKHQRTDRELKKGYWRVGPRRR
jgi:hypothetical protein